MYTNIVCCFCCSGVFRNFATDVHDVGYVLDHVNHKDGFFCWFNMSMFFVLLLMVLKIVHMLLMWLASLSSLSLCVLQNR